MEIEEKLVMYGLLRRELECYNDELNAMLGRVLGAEEHERLVEVVVKIEVIEGKIKELLR